MKLLATFALAAAALSQALAGDYQLVQISHLTLSGSGIYDSGTFSKSITGDTVSLTCDVSKVSGNDGNVSGSFAALEMVEVKVKWTPSYRGEPVPSTVSCRWHYTTTGSYGSGPIAPFPLTPTGSLTATGQFFPDGGVGTSASYNHIFYPGDNSQPISGEGDLWEGSVGAFHLENGEWVGTGNFNITTNGNADGHVDGGGLTWFHQSTLSAKLIQVDNDTVL
jgi:hypothetical protein